MQTSAVNPRDVVVHIEMEQKNQNSSTTAVVAKPHFTEPTLNRLPTRVSTGRRFAVFALTSGMHATSSFCTSNDPYSKKYESGAAQLALAVSANDLLKGQLQQINESVLYVTAIEEGQTEEQALAAARLAPFKRMGLMVATVGSAIFWDVNASIASHGQKPLIGSSTILTGAFATGQLFKEFAKGAKKMGMPGQVLLAVTSTGICFASAWLNRLPLSQPIKTATSNAMGPMFSKMIGFYAKGQKGKARKFGALAALLVQKLSIDIAFGLVMNPAEEGQNKYLTAGSGSAAFNYFFGIKKVLAKEKARDKVLNAVVNIVQEIDTKLYDQNAVKTIVTKLRHALIHRYNGNLGESIKLFHEANELLKNLQPTIAQDAMTAEERQIVVNSKKKCLGLMDSIDKVGVAVSKLIQEIEAQPYDQNAVQTIVTKLRQGLTHRYDGNLAEANKLFNEVSELLKNLKPKTQEDSMTPKERQTVANSKKKCLALMNTICEREKSKKRAVNLLKTGAKGAAVSAAVNGALVAGKAIFGNIPAGEPALASTSASLGKLALGSSVKGAAKKAKIGLVLTLHQLGHVALYATTAFAVNSAFNNHEPTADDLNTAMNQALAMTLSLQATKILRKNQFMPKAAVKKAELQHEIMGVGKSTKSNNLLNRIWTRIKTTATSAAASAQELYQTTNG